MVNKSPLQPSSSKKTSAAPKDIRSWLAPNSGKGKENRDVEKTPKEVKGKAQATIPAKKPEVKKKKRIESDESDFVMEEEPPSEGEEGSASDFEVVEEEPKTDDDLESVIDDVGEYGRGDGGASLIVSVDKPVKKNLGWVRKPSAAKKAPVNLCVNSRGPADPAEATTDPVSSLWAKKWTFAPRSRTLARTCHRCTTSRRCLTISYPECVLARDHGGLLILQVPDIVNLVKRLNGRKLRVATMCS